LINSRLQIKFQMETTPLLPKPTNPKTQAQSQPKPTQIPTTTTTATNTSATTSTGNSNESRDVESGPSESANPQAVAVTPSNTTASKRILGLDLHRGLLMVVMAIDVRIDLYIYSRI
jgi:hypothetical protein